MSTRILHLTPASLLVAPGVVGDGGGEGVDAALATQLLADSRHPGSPFPPFARGFLPYTSLTQKMSRYGRYSYHEIFYFIFALRACILYRRPRYSAPGILQHF